MQSELEFPRPYGKTYAEPLAGLRVSWGAILAGAATTAAVAVLLWALAFAITMTATHATFGSLRGATIALWICAMVTTLIGAFFGGAIAGYMPGNLARTIALGHGFLAWCLAFLLTTGLGWAVMAGVGTVVTETATTAAAGVAQGAGAMFGGTPAATAPRAGFARSTGPAALTPLQERELDALVTLGYSPEQARNMTAEQRAAAARANPGENPGMTAVGAVKTAGNRAIVVLEAVGWTWWGTWTAALLAALAGAAFGGQSLRRRARTTPVPNEGPLGGGTVAYPVVPQVPST